MSSSGHTWALVLAAGDGARLRTLTTTASGVVIPKQFCSLRGGHLRALPVPHCGWSDLGTPARVAETLRRVARHLRVSERSGCVIAHLDLAAQHYGLQRPS